MRIIFLDLSGVLVTERHNKLLNKKIGSPYPSVEWWADMIDPVCSRLMDALFASTDAFIVVYSTWRLGDTGLKLNEIFEEAGMGSSVIDITIGETLSEPESEIEHWLRRRPNISEFVVLTAEDLEDHFPGRVVRTNNEVGLTEYDVEKAQSILMNGWENVCEAIVAEAAAKIDDDHHELMMNGVELSFEDSDVWEQAHELRYRAVNMATQGSFKSVNQAIVNMLLEMEEE